MNQPYPYWWLDTGVASFIGLHTYVVNGGQLDDPNHNSTHQFDWLVDTLAKLGSKNDGRALILALHYPPYSGTTNFRERGDPTQSIYSGTANAEPIAGLLEKAFKKSNCFPDIVLSAHAHLYQRITYTYRDERQIPYLIVGSGGHGPVEKLLTSCDGHIKGAPDPFVRMDVVLPGQFTLPQGDTAKVVACNDQSFGFMRIAVDLSTKRVSGIFYSVAITGKSPPTAAPVDSFFLDLATHKVS